MLSLPKAEAAPVSQPCRHKAVLSKCAQVFERFQPISLRAFDQAVVGCTRFGTFRGITKEPVTPTYSEEVDSVLSRRIANVEVSVCTVNHQFWLMVQGIAHGLMGKTIQYQPDDVFFCSHLLVIKQRLTVFLPPAFFLWCGEFFDLFFNGIQLADFAQGYICFAGFIAL